jgi:uncharacterized membrane protein
LPESLGIQLNTLAYSWARPCLDLEHQQEASRSVEKQWQAGGGLQMLGPLPWVVGFLSLSKLVKSENNVRHVREGGVDDTQWQRAGHHQFFFFYRYIDRQIVSGGH